jgi:hypothetical protein
VTKIPSGSILFCSLCFAPPLFGQIDRPLNSLAPDARALSFAALGSRSGAIEYRRMRTPHSALGFALVARAGYDRAEMEDSLRTITSSQLGAGISVGPTLRRYVSTSDRVNPYAFGALLVGFDTGRQSPPSGPETSQWGLNGSLAAGIGLEWFPVREVSLSGQSGLQLTARYATSESGTVSAQQVGVGLNTFASSLSVSLYWPRRSPQ